MLFNSYPFLLVFLPLTLLGFFQLARVGVRYAALWLVAASLLFYAWWNPKFVLLLLLSIVINFVLGRRVAQLANTLPGKRLLIGVVAADLLLLGYFKYANFFIGTVNTLGYADIPLVSVVLPLGISFYTFTQIAFLVDSYRGLAREYDFVHYCLFVTYFPHLIAGPILHHQQMMPQFEAPATYRPVAENFSVGLTIFTIGLAKKLLFADSFAVFASPVFAAAASDTTLPAPLAWCGALAYTFQLYFDFSGYSDMAVGLSRLFGVNLPINFNSPYKATNIIEFWRRWHMTLSQFLRDYLYIPLGGNRAGVVRTYINLLATMLLGGLWHGANWTFVFWGGLHGIYLLINHAWRYLVGTAARGRKPSIWMSRFSTVLTFVCVVLAWVLFRAENLEAAMRMFDAMLSPLKPSEFIRTPSVLWGSIHASLMQSRDFYGALALGMREFFALVCIAGAIVWLAPNSQEYVSKQAGIKWRANRRNAFLWGIVMAVCLTRMVSVSEFLYFQF